MQFKKGTPKKKGLYVIQLADRQELIRIVSDQLHQRAESLCADGTWITCPTFPAGAKFSPRLRQAAGYGADDNVEQSLDQRLRNANVEIAKLKAERSGWRIVNSPDEIRGGKARFNLTPEMYQLEGVVKMIEEAGCTWAVDLHEPQRADFLMHWSKVGSGATAHWDVQNQCFDTHVVNVAWKLYKSMKGL